MSIRILIDDRRDPVRKIITATVLSIAFLGASSANAANIVETAQKAGKVGTLIAAAKAAGLVGALSKGKNLTVFAPTDAAFDKLPKGTVASLLKPENKSKLAAILSYHVLPRRLTSGQLPHKSIHLRLSQLTGEVVDPTQIEANYWSDKTDYDTWLRLISRLREICNHFDPSRAHRRLNCDLDQFDRPRAFPITLAENHITSITS